MARPIGGVAGPLSYEHVPARSAFNSTRVLIGDSGSLFGPKSYEQYLFPKGIFDQKGAGGYTICECNNNIGQWYVPSYAEWAVQGMRYLRTFPRGTSLSLPFKIAPLSIMKQILCMFTSACGPDSFIIHSELRKFALDRDCNYLPSSFNVYCCLMSDQSRASRQSGITGVIDTSRGTVRTRRFSEIAFPPFIYLLAIDSPPIDPELQDITFFAESVFGQYRQIHLRLEAREVASPFPGDFRTDKEIREVYRRHGILL
jgi:hypothetical protein